MDVTLPSSGGAADLPGYAALPDGATRGVVVVHEILGRQPEIERVVDRFGERGWAAVMPDLFAAGFLRCLVRAFRQVRTGHGDYFDRLRDARAWLSREAGIPEDRVAIIGFCLGGAFALAAGPGWGAVSANYGTVPPDEALAEGGPLVACYGSRERLVIGEEKKLRKAIERTGRDGVVHRFEGVGHCFLTDGEHWWNGRGAGDLLALRYDQEVAEEAWAVIEAFFDEHLPA